MVNVKGKNHRLNVKSDLKYRSYQFSLTVIKLTGNFPNQKVFWIIGDQLLRSATSIAANIVEAQAASSKREFIKFYGIALKSANETKYWLCLLRDSNLDGVNKTEIKAVLNEAIEVSNMLGAALLTLKGKKKI